MSGDSEQRAERILSIDIMRGFALICMVLVHFMIFYGNDGAVDTWPYFILNHVLGDWGAACFLMMMGMSQVLSGRKHESEGNWILFKRALIRGVCIFLAGILMLAVAWGPYQIWQWDILTLMGFATIMLYFCRFLPSWSILVIAAALAISAPWLRGGVDFNAVWGGQFIQVPVISRYLPGILLDPAKEFEVIWQAKDIAQGFFLNGYFPVIPWSLFPLVDLVMGRRIVSKRMRHDLPFLIIIGILLVCMGLGGAYAGRARPESSIINGFVAPLSFYPDSFTMICFQSGMALIVFGILYYCYDVRKRDKQKVSFMVSIYNRTSGFSLTFYFLHYILIGWPLALIYFITGKYYAGNLMGAIPALLCGIAAVVLLELLLYYWQKRAAKYSLEWFPVMLTFRFASPPKD